MAPRNTGQSVDGAPTSSISRITENDIRTMVGDYVEYAADPITDMTATLNRKDQVSLAALDEAARLLDTSKFKDWSASPYSGMLVVEGRLEADNDSTFPLSLFSVLMADTLRESRPEEKPGSTEAENLVLFFACGRHAPRGKRLRGPVGMVLSFISHLLIKWPSANRPHLDSLRGMDGLWEKGRDGRIEALCSVLKSLILELPRQTHIYCILDGFTQFQVVEGRWLEDMHVVMHNLRHCMGLIDARQGPRGFLKVLTTNRDRSDPFFLKSHRIGNQVVRPQLNDREPSSKTANELQQKIRRAMQQNGPLFTTTCHDDHLA